VEEDARANFARSHNGPRDSKFTLTQTAEKGRAEKAIKNGPDDFNKKMTKSPIGGGNEARQWAMGTRERDAVRSQ
jgi:hypothetical protein